jgi:hypothetical protein
MPPRTGADLLRLWDAGQDQGPLERALALLRAGDGGAEADGGEANPPDGANTSLAPSALEDLDVAARDARLFRLRAELFGPTLTGVDACPHCGAPAEFALDTSALVAAPETAHALRATEQGIDLRFRLPTTRDLLVALEEDEDAAGALARRCVLSAERAGDPLSPSSLPAEVLAALERRMGEAAPTAEVRLHLACAGCGGSWERLLDIARFLWDEIATEARRLAGEVHALARAYGWGEAEILGMSARRRQLYLELV